MRNRAFLALALLYIAGRFVTQTYARMLTNSNSAEGDQLAFLQLGLDLREYGILTDGTRNPLYAAFLALIAQREWAYFTQAKLISLAFGLLAIGAVFWLARRRYNTATGLIAAYLLSINTEFIVHSAQALTESLLVLCFVVAWFVMLAALDRSERPWLWTVAGVAAGLAYQAKGSAQLLVISFIIVAFLFPKSPTPSPSKNRGAAFLAARLTLLRTPAFWYFFAAYALVVAPLWIYNTGRFGSPTFNYPITHQMWMDSWRDWHPDDLDNLPTATSYLQSHSLAEIWERQWSGLQAMRNILVKTLWPTRTLVVDRFLLSPLSSYVLGGLLLLPLLLWPMTRRYLRAYGRDATLTLFVTFLFFILFAWYIPIVALGQRFLLPVVPLLFILTAHLLSLAGKWLWGRGQWGRLSVGTIAAIVIVAQLQWSLRTNLTQTQQFFSQSVFEQDRQFNAQAAVPLDWLVDQSPQPERVAYGPSGKSLPTWAFSDRLEFGLYPPRPESLADLTTDLIRRDLGYLVIDADMIARYRDLLDNAFPGNGRQIDVTQWPADWALTYAYPSLPCQTCLFRLLKAAPPQHPIAIQFDDGIDLIGYDLAASETQAGQVLPITLHWLARSQPSGSYTVFTQLLGPDLQLHGQLDHPPINGHWPTTRWQPGDHLADRYDLSIDPAAPPGEHQLLIGMYNPDTGQRLTATQNGQPVPDNAVRLAVITVTAPQAQR